MKRYKLFEHSASLEGLSAILIAIFTKLYVHINVLATIHKVICIFDGTHMYW